MVSTILFLLSVFCCQAAPFQTLVFRIRRVWVLIPSHDTCVLRMGRKAVGPMCCVTHIVKEPSAPIEKRRGSPRCSWLWLLYAPLHPVNSAK